MNPKKIWSNFAVSDLERIYKFYTQIGFKPNGSNDELTSFMVGGDSFIMHFFLKDILQTNIKGLITDAQQSNEIIFTISAGSKSQVDDWAKEVEPAGGKLVSQPGNLGRDTMASSLPTLMAIGSMFSTWKV